MTKLGTTFISSFRKNKQTVTFRKLSSRQKVCNMLENYANLEHCTRVLINDNVKFPFHWCGNCSHLEENHWKKMKFIILKKHCKVFGRNHSRQKLSNIFLGTGEQRLLRQFFLRLKKIRWNLKKNCVAFKKSANMCSPKMVNPVDVNSCIGSTYVGQQSVSRVMSLCGS